jgi:hypothetical protein
MLTRRGLGRASGASIMPPYLRMFFRINAVEGGKEGGNGGEKGEGEGEGGGGSSSLLSNLPGLIAGEDIEGIEDIEDIEGGGDESDSDFFLSIFLWCCSH